mmetsp:Transcript_33909/g.65179  ORF Transcript_33909/g.65179 Transcript_33909/m.65179 type:complete len:898 (-) Transcript_33909:305-2998(-)
MTDLPATPKVCRQSDGEGDSNDKGEDQESGNIPWPLSTSKSAIKSLTVSFSNGIEVWRSPPSSCTRTSDVVDYADIIPERDNNTTWPPGWVEVQTFQKKSSPNDKRLEFLPPHRPGRRGKSVSFHSIDEVRWYIKKQEQAAARKEKALRTRKSSESSNTPARRPRRSTASATQYEEDAFNSSDIKIGSLTELHHMMKIDNSLSRAMRNAIIHAGVLARKKDELYGTPTFIGVDGRTYPDLRLAFGKYANMKQCAVCKQRVQGAFYCRLKMMHIDVPDWDCTGHGGETDNLETLRKFFHTSIDELEGTQGKWELNSNDENGKKRSRRERDSQRSVPATGNGVIVNNISIDTLGEDLLYLVASFIPTLQQLVSFCQVSKRSHNLLYNSIHSENLFRGMFQRSFGNSVTLGDFERNLNWRERWGVIRGIRRGLVKESRRNTRVIPFAKDERRVGPQSLKLRTTLGVLNELDESDSVYYDNPEFASVATNPNPCVGYFGLDILFLPKPPNANSDWNPPVVVRGDFPGILIMSSIEKTVFKGEYDTDLGERQPNERRTDVVSVGDGDGGQVLALIQCDVTEATMDLEKNQKCPPCCFIGYASGMVAAVTATLCDDGRNYDFNISASHLAHSEELTALTFVNCSYSLKKDKPVLFSADCGGKVYFYPDALNADKGFSMERSVLALANDDGRPILSLASTVIHSKFHSYSVLCTGSDRGNIRVWQKADVNLHTLSALGKNKFRSVQSCKCSTNRGNSHHIVTRMVFMYNQLLVTGSNSGDLRVWQLKCFENKHRTGDAEVPKLTLRNELSNNHITGAIEFLANVGDLLIASGGNNGELICWDINTGLKLGSLDCHIGRPINGDRTLRSCVVEVFLDGKDGRIITLCRDGVLNQWEFKKYAIGIV